MLPSAFPQVVILTHGTWAAHAAWPMPGWLFRRAINPQGANCGVGLSADDLISVVGAGRAPD